MNLSSEHVEWALYALRDLISRRRLGGQPIPRELVDLYRDLDNSADGSQTPTAARELPTEDLIDTSQAAGILGCTTRRVTQIHADLDGVKIARTWVFRRQTVVEYAQAKGMGSDGNRILDVGCGAVPPRAA